MYNCFFLFFFKASFPVVYMMQLNLLKSFFFFQFNGLITLPIFSPFHLTVLLGRFAWRRSGLRSWWNTSRMRTITLTSWWAYADATVWFPRTVWSTLGNLISLIGSWTGKSIRKIQMIRHFFCKQRKGFFYLVKCYRTQTNALWQDKILKTIDSKSNRIFSFTREFQNN